MIGVIVFLVLAGIEFAGAAAASRYLSYGIPAVEAAVAYAVGVGIFFLLSMVLLIVLIVKVRGVNSLIDAGDYEGARRKELPWVIIGFIFGGIIVGILLLIAYMKLGDAANFSRLAAMTSGGQATQPGGGGTLL